MTDHGTIPALLCLQVNAELIEDAGGDVIDNVIDRLGMIIK